MCILGTSQFMSLWTGGLYLNRVARGFSVTRVVSQIISVMSDRAQLREVWLGLACDAWYTIFITRDLWFSFQISVIVENYLKLFEPAGG